MKRRYYIIAAVVLVGVIAAIMVGNGQKDKPQTAVKTVGSYVALGDSVAAGVGLADYADASACNRTLQSYPNDLAKTLNYNLTSFACSGATADAGLAGGQPVNGLTLPTQFAELQKQSVPDLVTVTIGANDAKWTDAIAACYTATCGSQADTQARMAVLEQVQSNLKTTFAALVSGYSSAKPKHIVVTGYYQVLPTAPQAGCVDLTGIDASELIWGREQQAAITEAVKVAAEQTAGVTFVPIDFSGHELCTADPWVQSLSDSAPYHPTAAGQRAIAQQLAKAIK